MPILSTPPSPFIDVGVRIKPRTVKSIRVGGNYSGSAPLTVGAFLDSDTATFTDTSTAASGTVATGTFNSFARPTYAATNTSVTVTDAATVYIANAPAAGTNVTLTNAYALWIDAGKSRFDAQTDFRDHSPELIDDVASGWVTSIYMAGTGGGGQNVFRRADGTETSPTAVLLNMNLGAFSFRGYTGSAFSGSKGFLAARVDENWSDTANGTRFEISTTPNGSTTLTEALRITSGQGVGIATWLRVGSATTAPTNATAGDVTLTRLTVNTDAAFSEANGLRIKAGNAITAATSTSIGYNLNNSITMAADNAQQIRVLNMENTINATSADVGTLYAGFFINRWNVTTATTSATNLTAGSFSGLFGSANINMAGVTNAIGVEAYGVNHFSTAPTNATTVTTAISVLAKNQSRGGVNLGITTSIGVSIEAQTLGTNNTNLLIGTVATGTWSIYNNSTSDNAHGGNSRFGGVTAPTTAVDVTGAVLATTTIKSSGATSGIGYATGAGGTVTQLTSKSTGVTLNTICGQITMHNAALAASTSVGFTVTNSAVATTDVIIVNIDSGATVDSYITQVDTVSAGSFRIQLRNISAGSLSEAVVLNFAVIKAVTS